MTSGSATYVVGDPRRLQFTVVGEKIHFFCVVCKCKISY